MDVDIWNERSAIMEFDGGLSRFEAETEAAREQGCQRWEMTNAVNRGSAPGAGDQPAMAGQPGAMPVPAMQPATQEEARPMPVGDPQ